MSPGGWSEIMPVDEEVSMLCKWMQNISEGKTNKSYGEFVAVLYRHQIVAGENDLVKVWVGGNEYVHLMIFQSPLLENTFTIKFLGVEGDHKLEDPLEPFINPSV
ncbi:leukocyte cysteine proteinase inhibitor 1-like isoform X1 [Cyprinodon tularosa]|uniref:leukocyte cysteine proteinase inhibitor 1-like isoform X1 n=1 Tax=Cyprinodon tularosa TaxID=77115 RepID=UPI0018E28E30|nr:leukocyte cysteine proteinase inhibitor 1-like isoform X1 [Cyprinodon tularosa]